MNEQYVETEEALQVKYDLLVERVAVWHQELVEARNNLEQILAQPAARVFLNQSKAPAISRHYQSKTIEENPEILQTLLMCTEQEHVADCLASYNNGEVELDEAVRIIRHLRLTNADNDQALRGNLAARLRKTGRWVRAGTSTYRSLAWKPPADQRVSSKS